MARKATFIPDTTGPQRTALDEIPQELKDYVESVYAKQRKSPGREHVEYENKAELEQEFKLIADYCAQRKTGILRVRRSPTRNQPDNVMEFRITADIEANGARNEGNDRKQPVGATK
jgi:hypothetical protein